jgi:Predicted ATP-dependent endonuclease of the OLD family
MSRGGPAVLRSLQDTVSALLGVQIDAFRSDTPRSETAAEIDVDNFLVQANGAGIRESLRLILDYEFQRPTILLVEEPEIHLHPALETNMMRYLRSLSSQCQVFITTHSTNFLDTAAMSNVYLVSRTGSTQIQVLDADNAEAQLPRELGLRMSSLFLYDRVVFVEGRTDEGVIREWASILDINFGRANVGFVLMGGARNFAYYAAEQTLSFLAKRQVRSWFLLDRDDRADAEIKKLITSASGPATVRVLQKREIENYLLSLPALAKFISWKVKLAGADRSEVTEQDVQKAIETAVEQLKETVLCKRVFKSAWSPIFPALRELTEHDPREIREKVSGEIDRLISDLQKAKSSIEDNMTKHAETLELDWPSRKFDVVPGDLLLDAVCKQFSVRFKKDKDSIRLASLMSLSEIPDEIKSIIREIGSEQSPLLV